MNAIKSRLNLVKGQLLVSKSHEKLFVNQGQGSDNLIPLLGKTLLFQLTVAELIFYIVPNHITNLINNFRYL